MIIQNSQVDMAAAYKKKATYTTKKETLMKNVQTKDAVYNKQEFSTSFESACYNTGRMPGYKQDKGELDTERQEAGYDNETVPVKENNEMKSVQALLHQLRLYLFEFRKSIYEYLTGRRLGSDFSSDDKGILNLSSGGGYSVWNRITSESLSYEESENMEFETVGKVTTADGRDIDFNLTVSMTREFCEEVSCIKQDTVAIMTDPIVISLESNPVSVSDEKWLFDIDGDGTKDSISLLSKGCGFLAFDKNENGIIDDGLELFGAKTGNGFAELLQYDEDNNGWIDENDSVYNKLSVYIKDDTGTDKLVSLKEANVGALYLGYANTEFALKNDENMHNAQLRKTGMYLSEDGVAKTMSQLDMVKALVG